MSGGLSLESSESVARVFLNRSHFSQKLDSKETQDQLKSLLDKIEADPMDNSDSRNNYVCLKSPADPGQSLDKSFDYVRYLQGCNDGSGVKNVSSLLQLSESSGLMIKEPPKRSRTFDLFSTDDSHFSAIDNVSSPQLLTHKIGANQGNYGDYHSSYVDGKPNRYHSVSSPTFFQYASPSNFQFSVNSSFHQAEVDLSKRLEIGYAPNLGASRIFESPRPLLNEKLQPSAPEKIEFKPRSSVDGEVSLPLNGTITDSLSFSSEFDRLPPIKLPVNFDLDTVTVEMAKDQNGSRLIQQRIEKANLRDISVMITRLAYNEQNLVMLVGDVFGNYVVQKFLDHGNEEHRRIIITKINGHILELATQMYGCRVIQKAIECGSALIQSLIIKELVGHVLECIKDQNGNHVIQKCIEKVNTSSLDFIVMEISSRILELSTHPYGCRVIQRILENFEDSQKERITTELFEHIPALILDQYGNYVVQHILDFCPTSVHRRFVFHYVKINILYLSSHKFASNVVEKCLVSGNASERADLTMEIINKSVGREDDVALKMMKDAYANYVIQKMIDVIIENHQVDLFHSLVKKIRPHYSNLRRISYGKHIINKIDKINKLLPRTSTNNLIDSNPEDLSFLKEAHSNPEALFSRTSETINFSMNSLPKNQQVLCESLTEFPSLICETRFPLEPR
ncbi:Pumilio 2 [Thelohanellus kitauei]|uniref:Pumilio 2 n=1 Tax=Thelohanellus kitauei TaxID=669202 RepID=A0A0C2NAE3_THEKT|nr:Pumilio 2 [Thelohanellus kitauei]